MSKIKAGGYRARILGCSVVASSSINIFFACDNRRVHCHPELLTNCPVGRENGNFEGHP
jgi:hypothetical protein